MASQTVENYLKAIYRAERELASPGALVPMGRLAAAMGVVPGTATTMVKALAESELAHYEAYAGVRLTPAGERLAALVLRRHRLVEQFLVQVMGMPWDEVHDEAERLEHAVSDRLIDRIDEMLGHPAVDPHGDPIPGPEGAMAAPHGDTLRSCPPERPGPHRARDGPAPGVPAAGGRRRPAAGNPRHGDRARRRDRRRASHARHRRRRHARRRDGGTASGGTDVMRTDESLSVPNGSLSVPNES